MCPAPQSLFEGFSADRTNGRAIGTVLRLSVVVYRLSVMLCIAAKRCVLEQKFIAIWLQAVRLRPIAELARTIITNSIHNIR